MVKLKRGMNPLLFILIVAVVCVAATALVLYVMGYRYISNNEGYKFIGKTENGEFPVKARDFAGENAEVINNGISSSDKNDPLNQFGTIGSRIDGVGAKLIAPECVLKAEIDITTDFVAGNDLYGADLKEIKVEVSSVGATSTTEDKPTTASKTDSGKVPTK